MDAGEMEREKKGGRRKRRKEEIKGGVLGVYVINQKFWLSL